MKKKSSELVKQQISHLFELRPLIILIKMLERTQELFTPLNHLSFKWGSCYSIFSFMCSILQIFVCPFVLFCFAIVLSVLLRYTDSNYAFGIFNLFSSINWLRIAHLFSFLCFSSFVVLCTQEEVEDNKEVIRIRKSKNRQHNGQKKKTQNDKQNIHIKLKMYPVSLDCPFSIFPSVFSNIYLQNF